MTAYLADTHVAIWAMDGDHRLASEHRRVLGSDAAVFVSMASLWEIAIKKSLGKLEAPPDVAGKLKLAGFGILNIGTVHVEVVEKLPHHHGDPFDRMIIAQAQVEGLTILTVDRHFAAYGVTIA